MTGDSYGPSPVSGGAPSPPIMIEGPRRPPSAPVGRRIDPYGESVGSFTFFDLHHSRTSSLRFNLVSSKPSNLQTFSFLPKPDLLVLFSFFTFFSSSFKFFLVCFSSCIFQFLLCSTVFFPTFLSPFSFRSFRNFVKMDDFFFC